MIDSIPSETPEQKKRVEGLKKLVPERVAPFVVGLCADARERRHRARSSRVRNNEIFLFSQPRPIRSAHSRRRLDARARRRDRVADAARRVSRRSTGLADAFTWDPV